MHRSPSQQATTPRGSGRTQDALGGDVALSLLAALRFKLPGEAAQRAGLYGQAFLNGGSLAPLSGGLSGAVHRLATTLRWSMVREAAWELPCYLQQAECWQLFNGIPLTNAGAVCSPVLYAGRHPAVENGRCRWQDGRQLCVESRDCASFLDARAQNVVSSDLTRHLLLLSFCCRVSALCGRCLLAGLSSTLAVCSQHSQTMSSAAPCSSASRLVCEHLRI